MEDVKQSTRGNKLYFWAYLVGHIIHLPADDPHECFICLSALPHAASDHYVRVKCRHICSRSCLVDLLARDEDAKCSRCKYPLCSFAVNPGPDGYDSDGPLDFYEFSTIKCSSDEDEEDEKDSDMEDMEDEEDVDSNGNPVEEFDPADDDELPKELYDSSDGDSDYWALRGGAGFGGGPEGYAKYKAKRIAHKARDFPRGGLPSGLMEKDYEVNDEEEEDEDEEDDDEEEEDEEDEDEEGEDDGIDAVTNSDSDDEMESD